MTNVLILGANGRISRLARDLFLKETDVKLTLYLRNAHRLKMVNPERERIIEGDVNDLEKLKEAMTGQDVVYSNIGSDIVRATKNIVAAMEKTSVKRLIAINALGIYDEVPGKFGEWNKRMCGSNLFEFRKAADIIEASDLDYTIIRGAWFTNKDEVDYEITQKGEPFKGTEISRKSIAAFVVKLAVTPGLEVRHSVGINKPNTDGDKPAFY
ncbi:MULTISPECIES: SDR family oxidoreductase [Heyndrickxia]|uniref:SDR family oxidoreductase n=1 Tax=Heyndrickxia TaxID=2837504 RepID=UPI002DB8B1B1|nr:SDR family oxidoreductase [Weizmannia sp. CD-2023]MEC2306421.1 SDR family oxidoreductase [Weizmannia sp. CD-2023]MEC2341080.1 SDR family oxidoreductase [Weizmannia sp. CD-2023]MED4312015.1 SDR family oxidoreductase [Heyndrickxia coagulans]